MGEESVVGVIPSFRPDERLLSAVSILESQVVELLVADDASPATFDLYLRQATSTHNVTLQRFAENAGVARSLNAGLNLALTAKASWLLTVDQDSTPSAEYVAALLRVAANAAAAGLRVGAVGGAITDASGPISYPTRYEGTVAITDEVLQTGTLWSVAALQEIGGFDETFGIDAVDAAACVRLRRLGFNTVLSDAPIAHSLGDARSVNILGRTVLATGHSPSRRTTMVRNRLRLASEEFAESPVQAGRTLRRLAMNTLLAITVEDNRWAKARGSVRGLLPKRTQS